MHDVVDYHYYYEKFAKDLCQGIGGKVTVFDFRGHGLSSGQRRYIDSYAEYLDDLESVITQIKDKPRVFVANGMGALVLLNFILERSSKLLDGDKFVFINPLIKFKEEFVQVPNKRLTGLFNLLSYYRLDLNYERQKLIENQELGAHFDLDPLVHSFLSYSLFSEIQTMSKNVMQQSYFFNRPGEFFVSKKSDYFDLDLAKVFIKSFPSTTINLKEYATSAHNLLTSQKSNIVIKDLIECLSLSQ